MSESTALQAIQIDAKVGLDEVVNVFVTEYEDNLHSEKARLQKDVKLAKSTLNKFETALEKSIEKANVQYVRKDKILGLSSSIKSVSIDYSKNVAKINVSIKYKDGGYGTIDKQFDDNIKVTDAKTHTKMVHEIETAGAELRLIMDQIRDVSRKERQIRGALSKKKLSEAGMDELLNDQSLQKLICIA